MLADVIFVKIIAYRSENMFKNGAFLFGIVPFHLFFNKRYISRERKVLVYKLKEECAAVNKLAKVVRCGP